MSYLPSPPAFNSDHEGVTVHQLLLAAQDAPSALEAVRQGLADSGAELCALSMKPVGQIVEGASWAASSNWWTVTPSWSELKAGGEGR